MITLAKNLHDNWYSFTVLVGINIKTSVLSTRLGWLWWILDPIFLMAIYYFLIKGVFGRGGENYHVFVLTGIISWQFFARSLTDAISSIPANTQIIKQIAFPLPLLIAVPIVSRLLFAVIGIAIVGIFEFGFVGIHTLAVFPVLITIALFSYGLGLFLSVISVYVGDIKHLVAYSLRAGFFITPILYPATRLLNSPNIPDTIKTILQMNPMMWIISALREVLLAGEIYDWQEYILLLLGCILIVQLGLVLIRRNASQIVKLL